MRVRLAIMEIMEIAPCEDDAMTHIRLAAPGDLHDLIEKDPSASHRTDGDPGSGSDPDRGGPRRA